MNRMQQVLAGMLAAGTLVIAPGAASAAPVNINKAGPEEIAASLQGIGLKKARDIVEFREKHGGFKTVEQLRDVKGIGDRMLEKNRANIRLQ